MSQLLIQTTLIRTDGIWGVHGVKNLSLEQILAVSAQGLFTSSSLSWTDNVMYQQMKMMQEIIYSFLLPMMNELAM